MRDGREEQGIRLRFVGLAVFLGLGLLAWFISKQDTVLALLLALLQVVFAVPFGMSVPPLGDNGARRVAREVFTRQRQDWGRLAASRHLDGFLDGDGRTDDELVPPRVHRWPDGWPPLQPGRLTREQVGIAVEQLLAGRRRVAVTGAEDVGKTVFQLLLLLQAQRERSNGRSSALPLRVPLAQWPVDGAGRPAALTLREWLSRRLREDYPGLDLSPGTRESFVDWLWDVEPGGPTRQVLFLDGIDELEIPAEQRARLLRTLLDEEELGAVALVVACRTETWEAFVAAGGRAGWATVELGVPQDEDVREFVTTDRWRDYLIGRSTGEGGGEPHPIRSSLRLLQVVADVYCRAAPLRPPPAWLDDPPTDRDAILHEFWRDVFSYVDWPTAEHPPDDADRRDFVATVAWLQRHRVFSGSGSAWWQIPRLAATDPVLAPAVRMARRRRLRSVLRWAAGAWAVGMLVVTGALARGWAVGYPRSDHGLGADRGLILSDLRGWDWRGLPVVVANPVYDALLAGAVLLALVWLLVVWGGELEHPDGGRPRPLRLAPPSLPQVWRLGLSVRRLSVLGAVTLLGLAVVVVEPRSAPAFAGIIALPWAITITLGWLLASVRSVEDGVGADPVGLFGRDRRVTGVVSVAVATAGAAATAVSHWSVTAGSEGSPSVVALVWTMTAVALFVGVGRGVYLGAAMGLTRLVPLPEDFGFGYAARLELLEHAARGQARTRAGASFRPRWLELYGIDPDDDRAVPSGLRRRRPGLGSDRGDGRRRAPTPYGVRLEAVVPTVGARLQLRDASIAPFLKDDFGDLAGATRVPGAPRRRLLGAARRAVATAGAVGVLAVGTGVTPVVLPRVLCGGVLRLPRPTGPGSATVAPNVWWENGQCVGFVVPGLVGWPGGNLQRAAGPGGELERRFQDALDKIAVANRASVRADGSVPLTVVFLAPLTRTDRSYAINALWQLEGVADALERVNGADSAVHVRLVVANTGENFVSGPAVVRALTRAFPSRDGVPGIDAVIGVAQSRQSARSALAALGDQVQVVGASVFGTMMKQGLPRDVPTLAAFTAVAPSDRQVAGPMVDEALAVARAAAPGRTPRFGIIYDSYDRYFSVDLQDALTAELERRFPDGQPPVKRRYTELASRAQNRRRQAELVTELCSPDRAGWVWLYAGRGNLWGELDQQIARTGPAGCQPLVVAGPGGTSVVASSRESSLEASNRLTFLALIQPGRAGIPAALTAAEAAEYTDRQLGAASLLMVNGLSGTDRCPAPLALGLSIDPRTGHNTLAHGDHPCSHPGGSAVTFCSFDDAEQRIPGRCVVAPREPAVPEPAPAVEEPLVVRATVNPQPRNATWLPIYREPRRRETALDLRLPWETRLSVVCQVPAAATDTEHEEAWVGVRYAAGSPGGTGASGFVRWRYRLRDRNVYLRFPDLGGALAAGRWTTRRLPAELPSCADSAALTRLIDVPDG